MPSASGRMLGSRLLWLVGGRLSLLLFALLSTGLMTRDLGPHGFGDFRTAAGYLGLVVLLADLGLASIFVREISMPGADRDRLVGNAIAVRLTLAMASIAVALPLLLLLPFTAEAKYAALWAAPGFLAYSLHLMLFGLFQQRMKQAEVVFAEIAGAAVLVGAVLMLRGRGASPAAFCAALSLNYLVTCGIALYFARAHASLVPRFELDVWIHLMRAAVPLALGTTMTIIYFQSPTILLAVLSTPTAVGNYGVPLKIFDSLMGIGLLAIGLAAPLLAHAAAANASRFSETLQQGMTLILLGGTALSLVLAASAEIVVAVMAGPAFQSTTATLQLFALLFVIHTCSLFLREAATAMHLQKRIAACIAPALLVAGAGFFALIPRFEGNGAVVALTAAESLLLFNFLRLILRHSSARLHWPAFARLVAAGLLAAAFIVACHAYDVSWWVTTALSLPVYAAALVGMGAFAARDLQRLATQVIGGLRPRN
jgi:O-antigen/teichoic acid export membrane protein